MSRMGMLLHSRMRSLTVLCWLVIVSAYSTCATEDQHSDSGFHARHLDDNGHPLQENLGNDPESAASYDVNDSEREIIVARADFGGESGRCGWNVAGKEAIGPKVQGNAIIGEDYAHHPFFFRAGPGFLGDLSQSYQGILSYELEWSRTSFGMIGTVEAPDIVISCKHAGITVAFEHVVDNPGLGVHQVSVEIKEGAKAYRLQDGQRGQLTGSDLRRCLLDVDAFMIRGGHFGGPESVALRNVKLSMGNFDWTMSSRYHRKLMADIHQTKSQEGLAHSTSETSNGQEPTQASKTSQEILGSHGPLPAHTLPKSGNTRLEDEIMIQSAEDQLQKSLANSAEFKVQLDEANQKLDAEVKKVKLCRAEVADAIEEHKAVQSKLKAAEQDIEGLKLMKEQLLRQESAVDRLRRLKQKEIEDLQKTCIAASEHLQLKAEVTESRQLLADAQSQVESTALEKQKVGQMLKDCQAANTAFENRISLLRADSNSTAELFQSAQQALQSTLLGEQQRTSELLSKNEQLQSALSRQSSRARQGLSAVGLVVAWVPALISSMIIGLTHESHVRVSVGKAISFVAILFGCGSLCAFRVKAFLLESNETLGESTRSGDLLGLIMSNAIPGFLKTSLADSHVLCEWIGWLCLILYALGMVLQPLLLPSSRSAVSSALAWVSILYSAFHSGEGLGSNSERILVLVACMGLSAFTSALPDVHSKIGFQQQNGAQAVPKTPASRHVENALDALDDVNDLSASVEDKRKRNVDNRNILSSKKVMLQTPFRKRLFDVQSKSQVVEGQKSGSFAPNAKADVGDVLRAVVELPVESQSVKLHDFLLRNGDQFPSSDQFVKVKLGSKHKKVPKQFARDAASLLVLDGEEFEDLGVDEMTWVAKAVEWVVLRAGRKTDTVLKVANQNAGIFLYSQCVKTLKNFPVVVLQHGDHAMGLSTGSHGGAQMVFMATFDVVEQENVQGTRISIHSELAIDFKDETVAWRLESADSQSLEDQDSE